MPVQGLGFCNVMGSDACTRFQREKAMDPIEKVERIVARVPEKWREDFCLLLIGETPSDQFQQFYDNDTICQGCAEEILRLLDGGLVQTLTALYPRTDYR